MAAVGIAIAILWPTKRWLGYVFLALAFLLGIGWAVSAWLTKDEAKTQTPLPHTHIAMSVTGIAQKNPTEFFMKDPFAPGQDLRFNVAYRNAGPANATNASISARLLIASSEREIDDYFKQLNDVYKSPWKGAPLDYPDSRFMTTPSIGKLNEDQSEKIKQGKSLVVVVGATRYSDPSGYFPAKFMLVATET